MGDSLVPVDHQPDFDGASLIPVDHDPFGADNTAAQPEMASEPRQTELGSDKSNFVAPPKIDLPPNRNAGAHMSGSVIPICTYTDRQESRRFGITTCNYFCGDDITTSKTFPFGTRCPGLILMPGG
jgi:hypothetical protein